MTATFLKGVVLGVVVSSVMLISSAAFAGSGVGAIFNLGKTNLVNAGTGLSGSTNGNVLGVRNTNTGARAGGIGISVANGKPPLVVNSSTKVSHLNADLLDGLDSSKFQQPVTGACTHSTAIAGVMQNGAISCTSSAVFPIAANLSSNSQTSSVFPPSSLSIVTLCHDSGTEVFFFNEGSNAATLNWMFSQGGTASTVNASGNALGARTDLSFTFTGGRLEGQWIFAEPGIVTTVNLHAFDAGTGCEVRGTAEVAVTS